MSDTITQSLSVLKTAKSNIAAAITNKGGTVQSGDGFSNFATRIGAIPSGGGGSATEPYVEYTINASNEITDLKIYGFTALPYYMCYKYDKLITFDFVGSPGLTSIGNNAFQGCTTLVLTSLPSSLTTIQGFAFQGCTSLTNVEIPCSMIGHSSFFGCGNLNKVWLRSSVVSIPATSVGVSPFYGCAPSLVIYVEDDTIPAGWGAYFNRTGASGATVATVVYGQKTRPW